MEESPGHWRDEVEEGGHPAGGFAHQRNVAGVAAEGSDVIADPAEGHYLKDRKQKKICQVVKHNIFEQNKALSKCIDAKSITYFFIWYLQKILLVLTHEISSKQSIQYQHTYKLAYS